jgi:hypothetical protein
VDRGALAVTWAEFLPAEPNDDWQAAAERIAREADQRRARADYDTGSVTVYEAYLLRALAEYLVASVVIEVGTFIGTSTLALASAESVEAVYTCDISNDCLDATDVIRTFPKQSSTDMLTRLVQKGVRADLCFFDGVLRNEDVALLAEVAHSATVFATHDYNYGPKIRVKNGVEYLETVPRKGIGNVRLLQQRWPSHLVIEPLPETTLALLVPRFMA